jgi:hypothetical protein
MFSRCLTTLSVIRYVNILELKSPFLAVFRAEGFINKSIFTESQIVGILKEGKCGIHYFVAIAQSLKITLVS